MNQTSVYLPGDLERGRSTRLDEDEKNALEKIERVESQFEQEAKGSIV